jgi:hypothetical protein
MKSERIHGTRGVALPLAVFALLVIGALAATSLLLGRQELAAGANALRLQESLAAAEGATQLQLALWDAAALNGLGVGDSVPFAGSVPTGGPYRGAIRRLSGLLFLIRAEGFSRDSLARQQVGLLVRLRPIEVAVTAALRAAGPIAVSGLARVGGEGQVPAGWTHCAGEESAVAGIAVPDSGAVSVAACAEPDCVTGAPAVRSDPALDSATISRFGDAGFDDLRRRASVTVAGGLHLVGPSLVGGVCDVRDPDNWGSPHQPDGPCGGRFPIIWSEGDLVIAGGAGQGVLVVNGDLTIGGGFTFYGVVLVRGVLTTVGPGGTILGGVLVVGGAGQHTALGGNTVIRYSACAAARGLLRSAPAVPVRSRSWVRLD